MEAFGYRIVAESALAENLQLHVLARAYRDAWLALKRATAVWAGTASRDLGVTIEFEEPG